MLQGWTNSWPLDRRERVLAGEVGYEVFGEGTPVVLIHGTPARSYLWRKVAPVLAKHHCVYTYDLLGFGESERREGQNVSIAGQARLLKELIEAWELDEPAVIGHDIGGGIALRAHLLEGVRFRRIALLDAVLLTPWLSQPKSSTWHIRKHAEAYKTMPDHIFEAFFSAYLKEAGSRLGEDAFKAYLVQWQGEEGRQAFVNQAIQLEERHTAELESLLGSISVPVQIFWGEEDRWLDPVQADRLHEAIRNSSVRKIPGVGHFIPEDIPQEIARELVTFFSKEDEPK
jgi:pimeloyl-ACP methyl ester carboxylesterase